jgi:NAD(P)H dehydrogenase (quinone)
VIALTGVTGQVGGRVARLLAERGVPLRLIVRDASRAPQLPGAEVAVASDYGATNEMKRAIEGADTLFLVSGRESPSRIEQHFSAVDAALAAGVERIVYQSFLGASPDSTFTLVRHHWATEEHIRAAGVRYTFPRMSMFLDFLPSMVSPDGVIAGPAGDGHFAPVLRADVADVAAAVLAGGEYDGQTFDVTGRERLTMAEAAAQMAELSGKRIVFRDETIDEAYESRSGFGAPADEVEGWVTSYTAIAEGELDVVSDSVKRVAGHEPVTLAEFVREHPESLAHVG